MGSDVLKFNPKAFAAPCVKSPFSILEVKE
jgi:hypothetical protein